MELTGRQKKILRAVVEGYIDSAEPIGSHTVLARTGLTCSSATIRNELAALTREGYLEQPHTSAGRVPTAKGYRLYVNELMMERELSHSETEEINRKLQSTPAGTDKLMADVGKMATELTSYPALTISAAASATVKRVDLIYLDPNSFIIVLLLTGDTVKNKLVHLPFSSTELLLKRLSALFNANFTGLSEERITPELIASTERAAGDTMGVTSVVAGFLIETLMTSKGAGASVSGEANLLKLPEFQDPDKAHRLINYLSDSRNLSALTAAPDFGDVKVLIGPENAALELRDSSVVLASYDAGDGMRGLIGVVGPTRMDYSAVAAKLAYIAGGLSRLLGAGSSPPAGFGKLMIKGGDSDVQK